MKPQKPATPASRYLPKTKVEIQYAHDLLSAIILRDIHPNLDPAHRKTTGICLHVLCWVLGHNHNAAFTHLLEILSEGIVEVSPRKPTSTPAEN
jgi:hypothetical protein